MMYEGMIVEIVGGLVARVDFGDEIEEFPLENCSLVIGGLEYEIGDHVQVQPEGMSLFFSGVVIGINSDNTLDVRMDGDDEEDIERKVPLDRVVKVKSGRPMALSRWRKIKTSIAAAHLFKEFGNRRIQHSVSEDNEKDHHLVIRRQQTNA